MNITGKSFSIWLVTNFTGTFLYSLIPLGEENIRVGSNPGTAMLILIFGLLFSIPAIPFTYLNLLFIRSMRTEKSIRYLYTTFSVLIFICIAALLIVTVLGGQIPGENDLEDFQLIWAHTLMAIVTTVWFANDIIEQKENSSSSARESHIKDNETVIHKL